MCSTWSSANAAQDWIQILNRLPASLNHLRFELEIAFVFHIWGCKPTRGIWCSHFWFTRKMSTHKENLCASFHFKQAMLLLISKNLSDWKAFEICFEEKLLAHASLLSYWQFLFARIHWPLLHIPQPWKAQTRTLEKNLKK